MRVRGTGVSLLLLAASMIGFPTAARASSTIERRVVGAGGGRATGGGRMLVGTVGQASIGMSAGSSNSLCAGFWCSGRGAAVSVEDPGLPIFPVFDGPAPNPTAEAARFAITLPGSRQVELAVFDAAGRRIRVLANLPLGTGPHIWTWDLRGDGGERVPAGIYFSRLVVDNRMVGSRKIVVCR